ncbi:hypothetical protein WA026_014214 [Henosepilachna vigintioctopunctata]|uniref:Uncharacterized protein n=1 Tax=Henosepilachna vigintioctopunctata TaxID=420089 RepID=A0AAW1TLZ7_9CUCU
MASEAQNHLCYEQSGGLACYVLTKLGTIFFVSSVIAFKLVSRNTAGKKETITKGKEKVQKRFLLDSMKNLFKAFKSENPNAKCSYFYFTKNRPFYVVIPTVDGRDMCLCEVHSNAATKIKALKQKRVISALDLSTLISETVCDSTKKECCTCNQCRDKEFKINSDSV